MKVLLQFMFFYWFRKSLKFDLELRGNLLLQLKWRSSELRHTEKYLSFLLVSWEEVILLKTSCEEVLALKSRKMLTITWVWEILDFYASRWFNTSWRKWDDIEVFKMISLRTRRLSWEDLSRSFSKEEAFELKLRTALQNLIDKDLDVKWKTLS